MAETYRNIVIISPRARDRQVLAECLLGARPERFRVDCREVQDRPVELLADPHVDAIIMARGAESDYLLRLARREGFPIPIILLLDDDSGREITPDRAPGKLDFIRRDQIGDELVIRILDYSIALNQSRRRIRQLTKRDTMTGALNRSGFRAHLQRAIDRSERYGFQTALLYFNIDQMERINELYGEENGDLVIKAVSHRIVSKMRNTDSIARLAGSEFAVVLEDVSSSRDVENIADKMLQNACRTLPLGEHRIAISASLGAAIYPDDGRSFDELSEAARSAMQQAKSLGGGKYIRYSEKHDAIGNGRESLAMEMRSAIRSNQFELRYQPRVALGNEQLVGLEALLRWNHPERGLISPDEFLAACEDMRLLRAISYQLVQQACSALKWLEEHGLPEVKIAVNISFSQLRDDRFVEVVQEILQRNGIDGRRLELELTESAILQSPDTIKQLMDQLRESGVTFSLDDFGTGYSQLTHIVDLPISSLKIDASFVSGIPHNHRQEAICIMIIDMVHRLGMTVVAEGVENHEQVEFLRSQGCHEVQGYYYSPALSLEQLSLFIEQSRLKREDKLIS